MNKEQAIKKKAEWLSYCLNIGFPKSDLDELSNIWDKFKDENGNLKEQPSTPTEQDEKDKLIEQLKKDKIELMSVLDSLSNGEAMNVIRESEGVYTVIFKTKETKGNS